MQTPYISVTKEYYDSFFATTKPLFYSAPLSDPGGGTLRFHNNGHTNGPGYYRGSLTQNCSPLNAYLEPAGIFYTLEAPEYPSEAVPIEVSAGVECGAVSVVLPLGQDDFLVGGHLGVGRITGGVTAWFRAVTSPARLPTVIATDGSNALFIYTENTSVTITPFTVTHRYFSIPISGSSGSIDYSSLPIYTFVTDNFGRAGQMAILGAQMTAFTVGVMNFFTQSPDGFFMDGQFSLVGPAVLQGDGSYNVNAFGWGNYALPYYMAASNLTYNAKAVGSTITANETLSVAPLVISSAYEVYFPPSIPGYPNPNEIFWGEAGFGYSATPPPGLFWSNLRNCAEVS